MLGFKRVVKTMVGTFTREELKNGGYRYLDLISKEQDIFERRLKDLNNLKKVKTMVDLKNRMDNFESTDNYLFKLREEELMIHDKYIGDSNGTN